MALQRLVTLGYEGASIEQFLGALRRHGVTLVLDIRELAASRRRGFAKRALRAHLALAGIGYRHEPQLGSPRELRHRQRRDGDYERFFRDFDHYLSGREALLQRLAGELTGVIALLCYERDYRQCHRRSVAAALARLTGLAPEHADGQGADHPQ